MTPAARTTRCRPTFSGVSRCVVLLMLATTIELGCAAGPQTATVGAPLPPAAQSFAFRDGGVAFYFEIAKSLVVAARRRESWIFVFGGSGCIAMGPILPDYFRGLEGESGPLRVFVLHKRFVGAFTESTPCSDDFVRWDHPRQWLADYQEFVESLLAHGDPGRVVLVGISEGGEVVPLLARRISRVTHVVLLGNPGADSLESYRALGEKHGIGEVDRVLRALREPPPLDPDSPKARVAGRSWRYWSELAELKTRESILELALPIMIGMGGADVLMPVELVQQTRDAHAKRGRGPLTLAVFPDADHGLFDASRGRNRLPDFWHQVDLWLGQ